MTLKDWFDAEYVADSAERTLAFHLRFFGLDFSLLLLGYLNDWMIIDLRVPCQGGLLCQVLFAVIHVGRIR